MGWGSSQYALEVVIPEPPLWIFAELGTAYEARPPELLILPAAAFLYEGETGGLASICPLLCTLKGDSGRLVLGAESPLRNVKDCQSFAHRSW